MFERRAFLKGLLVSASAAASTALVKLANPAEVKALVPQSPVFLKHPAPVQMPDMGAFGHEVYLCNLDGEFIPVGYVTELTIECPFESLISWKGEAAIVPGLKRANLRFEGWQ